MDGGKSARGRGDNLIRANKEAARAIVVAIINLVVVRCLPPFFLSSLRTSVATSYPPLYVRDMIKENAGNCTMLTSMFSPIPFWSSRDGYFSCRWMSLFRTNKQVKPNTPREKSRKKMVKTWKTWLNRIQ